MKKHDAQTTGLRKEKETKSFLKRKNLFKLRYYHAFLIYDDDRFYFVGSQCSI